MSIINKFDIDKVIEERTNAGKALAVKFPELKGLPIGLMLSKLPMELDFITGNEMWLALNKEL